MLMNSVKTNLRYNKHPVPRDQLIKRRVKVRCVFRHRPHAIKFNLNEYLGLLYLQEKYGPY